MQHIDRTAQFHRCKIRPKNGEGFEAEIETKVWSNVEQVLTKMTVGKISQSRQEKVDNKIARYELLDCPIVALSSYNANKLKLRLIQCQLTFPFTRLGILIWIQRFWYLVSSLLFVRNNDHLAFDMIAELRLIKQATDWICQQHAIAIRHIFLARKWRPENDRFRRWPEISLRLHISTLI